MSTLHLHRGAELKSLALHRAVAEKLLRDPEVMVQARRRVANWLAGEEPFGGNLEYARRWQIELTRPSEGIVEMLLRDDEWARDMRQCSPFAGVLSASERRDVLDSLNHESASALSL